MYIQIDERIYKWLLSLGVLKPEGRKQKNSSQIELSLSTSLSLESGVIFAKLLRSLLANAQTPGKIPPLPSLDSLKEFSTPTSRLYNWNILTEAYKSINVDIKSDMKSLIVAGDRGCVVDFLKEIYTKIVKGAAEDKTNPEFEDFDELALDSSNFAGKSFILNENKKKGIHIDSIDLNKIQLDLPIEKAESLLEFFIISVGKHMNLTSKQAASLFTKGSKYLAHVVIKGLKGNYEPITTFLQEIYANIDYMLELLEKESSKSSLSFSLQALKPGLVSKSTEVSQWTLRIFSNLSFEFLKRNFQTQAWEWFIGPNQGFLSFLRCLKRHPDLKNELLSVLMQIGRYNFLEMLTSLLKKQESDPKDFFYTVTELMQPISENKSLKEDIINAGVLEYWIEYASNLVLEDDRNVRVDAKIEILRFFTEVWVNYADKIEEKEEKAAKIVDFLKKATEAKQFMVKIIAITQLFRLLAHFGNGKKAFAPMIFKTLTIVLLENHANLDLRDHILRNFISIFEEFPNIPIAPLFEPLIKQIGISENTTYQINITDLTLFVYFSKSTSLAIKNAVQLLDLLAKIFLNQLVFAQVCTAPMITLIMNHRSNETMQEFVVKFVKICLAMLYASERKKRSNNQAKIAHNSSEIEVVSSQKRALIIEMLRQICSVGSEELTTKLKPLIAHTCLQIKEFSQKNHKGLTFVLGMFGDAEALLSQYEQDYLESLKQRHEEEQQYNKTDNSDSKLKSSDLLSRKPKNVTSLSTNFADPKALKAIEGLKQTFNMKLTGKAQQEVEAQKALEKQKAALRKQLELRSIQQGVGIQNQKDGKVQLIYEEGILKPSDVIEDNPMEIVDLELEEDRDSLLVEDFRKKNHKVFKYLFLKYANSGYWSKPESFSKISEAKSQKINISELVKLFKEHGYENINQEKVTTAVKGVSQLFTGSKTGIVNLDYHQFQSLFLQLAVVMHGKEFNGGPISLSLEKMLRTFKEEEKKQGLNVAIYEDPLINFIYEGAVMKEIDKNLQSDPNYVLPEGFKKYQEQRVKFEYKLPETIGIEENYRIVYESLNEIVMESLGINLIEPFATFSTVTLARPKLHHVDNTPIKLYENKKYISSADEHLAKIEEKKNYKYTPEPVKEKHRVLEITRKRGLSLEMKLHVASCDQKFKYITEECAYVIEDLIDAVVLKKNTIDWVGVKQNKALLSKKELEKIIEEEQDEKEKLRRIRHEQIKKELKEKGTAPKKQILKEEDRKYLQQKDKSEKIWEARLKENEDKKKKVKEYHKSKSEEKEEKKREEENKLSEIKRLKDKQFEEFNKKVKSEMKEKFKQSIVERDNEKKAKEEKEYQEKLKWKEYNEKVLPKKFEKETKMHKLEQGVKKTVVSLLSEPDFSLFFEKYQVIIRVLFEYLVKRTFVPLNYKGQPASISLEALSLFAADFNLCPSVFSLREIVLIYKSLTKEKPPVMIKDTISSGVEYKEINEFLLRIAIKGQKVFNQIGLKIKESGTIIEEDLKRIILESENSHQNSKKSKYLKVKSEDFKGEKAILERYKNVSDEYAEIEKTTVLTLEGMFYYLGLPLDPSDRGYIEKKLKEIRVKKTIPNKYKKKDLERKLEDGIRYESPKRKVRSNDIMRKRKIEMKVESQRKSEEIKEIKGKQEENQEEVENQEEREENQEEKEQEHDEKEENHEENHQEDEGEEHNSAKSETR